MFLGSHPVYMGKSLAYFIGGVTSLALGVVFLEEAYCRSDVIRYALQTNAQQVIHFSYSYISGTFLDSLT